MRSDPYHKGLWCSGPRPHDDSRKRASSRSSAEHTKDLDIACRLECLHGQTGEFLSSTDSCSRRPCDSTHVALDIAHYFGRKLA